jgi:hypothetical protein
MPKKITKEAALLIAAALFLAWIGAVALRDAGEKMEMTAGGVFVLGLMVAVAGDRLPKPGPGQ